MTCAYKLEGNFPRFHGQISISRDHDWGSTSVRQMLAVFWGTNQTLDLELRLLPLQVQALIAHVVQLTTYISDLYPTIKQSVCYIQDIAVSINIVRLISNIGASTQSPRPFNLCTARACLSQSLNVESISSHEMKTLSRLQHEVPVTLSVMHAQLIPNSELQPASPSMPILQLSIILER